MGTTRRNRKGAETWLKRRYNKLCGKTSWYKLAGDYERLQELAWDPEENQNSRNSNVRKPHRKPDDRYIESVMFVPYTPESQLKTQLTKMESKLPNRTRFRYVEETGITLAASCAERILIQQNVGARTAFPAKPRQGLA